MLFHAHVQFTRQVPRIHGLGFIHLVNPLCRYECSQVFLDLPRPQFSATLRRSLGLFLPFRHIDPPHNQPKAQFRNPRRHHDGREKHRFHFWTEEQHQTVGEITEPRDDHQNAEGFGKKARVENQIAKSDANESEAGSRHSHCQTTGARAMPKLAVVKPSAF